MSGGVTIVLQEKPVQKSKKALILLQKAQKKYLFLLVVLKHLLNRWQEKYKL